jgi:hypothetical protein
MARSRLAAATDDETGQSRRDMKRMTPMATARPAALRAARRLSTSAALRRKPASYTTCRDTKPPDGLSRPPGAPAVGPRWRRHGTPYSAVAPRTPRLHSRRRQQSALRPSPLVAACLLLQDWPRGAGNPKAASAARRSRRSSRALGRHARRAGRSPRPMLGRLEIARIRTSASVDSPP